MNVGEYHGSRFLEDLTGMVGLPLDQLNFICCLFVSLILSKLYRTLLHPSTTKPAVRHAFGLITGLILGYFCYGYYVIHLIGLPTLCYIIIITQNANIVHGLVLAVSLMYLSFFHIHRQIYSYGMYGLDITGPLMVITQKVSSLAFSLHDGLTKTEAELIGSQKKLALTKVPNPLEFFSYLLLYQTLFVGPLIFYRDYIDFIEGRGYNVCNQNGQSANKTPIILEPNPRPAVVKKLITALICVSIFLIYSPLFPIEKVKEDNFIENTTLSYKFWYLTLSTTAVRCKYYFVWTFADAICNNCGLGFNGYTENGVEKWDKIENVDIFGYEFSKSLKEAIESWNKGTNVWLRMMVYERTKRWATLLTFSLSAVWHGFYPGYYLTFLGGALFTFASRIIRRGVRHYFIGNFASKLLYDLITFVATRIVLTYIVFPFVLLEFWSSVRVYNNMYWFLHIVSAVALLLVPTVFKPNRRVIATSSKTDNGLSSSQHID